MDSKEQGQSEKRKDPLAQVADAMGAMSQSVGHLVDRMDQQCRDTQSAGDSREDDRTTNSQKDQSQPNSGNQSGGAAGSRRKGELNWKSDQFKLAREDLETAIGNQRAGGGIKGKQALFQIAYAATRAIARRQSTRESIFFVLTGLWERVQGDDSGKRVDGEGSPKDIIRRFCRKAQLDYQGGEWIDGGEAITLIIEQGGMKRILEDVACDVLGQGWTNSMRQGIQTMTMEPGDDHETHFAKYRERLDNLPPFAAFGEPEQANIYFDTMPSEVGSKARVAYAKRKLMLALEAF